jgi:hypothetical protein
VISAARNIIRLVDGYVPDFTLVLTPEFYENGVLAVFTIFHAISSFSVMK